MQKNHNDEPYYELKFKGKTTANFIPIEGTLSIEGIFIFDAKWENGKIMRSATLYDAISQIYEERNYAFGIRTYPKSASTETVEGQ